MTNLTAIEVELLRNGLTSICDEMYVALMRSAYSTNIKERKDHSTAIFDVRGRVIVQGESMPLHLASMLGLVEVVLERVGPENLQPGDMFISNDPFVGRGSHLPDVALVAPVFYGDQLVFFVADIAPEGDDGTDLASPALRRSAAHDGVDDSRVHHEGLLDLLGEDLLAPGVDRHRVTPVEDEVAVLVQLGTVAGKGHPLADHHREGARPQHQIHTPTGQPPQGNRIPHFHQFAPPHPRPPACPRPPAARPAPAPPDPAPPPAAAAGPGPGAWPGCQTRLQIADPTRPLTVKCPTCATPLTPQATAGAAPPTAPAPPPAAAPAPAPAAPPPVGPVTISCPGCQTQMKIADTRRPLTVACPGCQTQLKLT